jgi:type I restriction enzyme R subunit
MSNFAFLPAELHSISEFAIKAEGHIQGDPRAACFHARFTLERVVHWLYRHDGSLQVPYDRSLNSLLHTQGFQALLPLAVFQKARLIQKMGNLAVHDAKPVSSPDALQAVKELHHICHWLVHTYMPDVQADCHRWQDAFIGLADKRAAVSRKKLEMLEKELAEKAEENLQQQQERDKLDKELQQLREKLAAIRAASQNKPDRHDYSEAETRHYLIDVDLRRAGWTLEHKDDKEYPVTGMPNAQGVGYADYVLWGNDGKPLAVVEAKKTTVDPSNGQQQAKLYADCLEQMHGQRPIIFFTNGYTTWLWDDASYPEREVAGFYKKDELSRLILRRTTRKALDVKAIKDAIVERYYQKRALASIFEHFTTCHRKALLVMATGTGKTRTAIALVDVLQQAGWIKRALFLADRVSLVNQAVNAFKTHLPEASPVNLVTDKNGQGRVYVCTYPTMMGLIDATQGSEAKFSVGHFDLIIIDEAHRSVYQKYGAIFRYFDSLLVGLTATPREEVDKNTYTLFELAQGVPTDAYELQQAVDDGFLVPPTAEIVDLKFPRKGIKYDELSDADKEEWAKTDWGGNGDAGNSPGEVSPAAVNNWLFNNTTADIMLKYLMEYGHKVDGGDRLAKTIIFARNHKHAKFLTKRFNRHYPHYKSKFARIIDNQVKYPQSLIDDFSQAKKVPHIAVSVDMLDTGIDVPEVANLVFAKPIYSKIKFWQMIGRGTRLCPDLFGPGEHKKDFRIFDFCGNFDFFKENPEGIKTGGSAPLGVRLFQSKVQLLGYVQTARDLDPDEALQTSLAGELHRRVAGMNRNNFMVRMSLQAVERFQDRKAWNHLSESDRQVLFQDVAALPGPVDDDKIESRIFDLMILQMQLALAEGNDGAFLVRRDKVQGIARLLEEKGNIPTVKAQLAYLSSLQDTAFWEGMNLAVLEDLRLRVRGLVPLLDKQSRDDVYTDFQDEIVATRSEQAVPMPKMTGVEYEKRVAEYLTQHLDHIVIHRLRSNQPLTPTDLKELERTLAEIGNGEGETLLDGLLARKGAPSLVYFVKSMAGMDRAAAQAAFSGFLADGSLSTSQIRFVEMIIEQLTARGIMEADALYEPPFSNLHSGGPDELFAGKETVIEGIFDALKAVNGDLDAMVG